ncbi:hypothetical protein BDN72DRAFT_68002 [Pluteus cervinus]|uniref:Uncharacterized protein n=1 Tax=Pluteus cervinus TaxID=181527 RepID=A0ACD3A0Z0_9AGAR|nr:hypothetical protein BDN72DRAFT_68002 [Pluteus cervinus]
MYHTSRSQPEHTKVNITSNLDEIDAFHVFKTRAALVRVCKQWRTWTLPFLYEYVVILSGRQLGPLLETPQCSLGTGLEDVDAWFLRPFGNLVKRFDLALYEYSTSPESEASNQLHEDWEVIAQIAGYLPNLQSLNIYPCMRSDLGLAMPTSFAQALAQTCGESLQILNTFDDRHRFQLSDLYGLLLHTPNLRVLRCRAHKPQMYLEPEPPSLRPTWATVLTPDPLTKIVLPHLASVYARIELTGRLPGSPVISTPQIRHLIIHSSANLPPPNHFFLSSTSSPTYIQLYQDHAPFSYQTLMGQLRECCPNLRRLDFNVSEWGNL